MVDDIVSVAPASHTKLNLKKKIRMTTTYYQMTESILLFSYDIRTRKLFLEACRTQVLFFHFLCTVILSTGWMIHKQSGCEAIHKNSRSTGTVCLFVLRGSNCAQFEEARFFISLGDLVKGCLQYF